MMKRYLLVCIVILTSFVAEVSFSQNQGKGIPANVRSIAESFLTVNSCADTYSVLNIEKQELLNHARLYIVRLKPVGFIIISSSSASPVLAYSFKSDYSTLPDERLTANALMQSILMQKPEASQFKESLVEKSTGPFVHALWGQVNCYDNDNNLINVTNYFTPHHYAAGCVAISLSLVLHYYQWPVIGTGSYEYTDNRGSNTGTYSADFENTPYQWHNMLNRYKYRSSTDIQRQAVGELAYQAAVALKTDFEHNGSTSNVNRIPSVGENYFRFSGMERTPSSKVFWSMLDTNMAYGIPVIFAIKSTSGAGHAIVCDGLKIDENGVYYYHLNMGWWGSSNGWYRIRSTWDAGGYNTITDGIFYFLPIPQLLVPHITEGQKNVDVTWRYPSKVNVQAFELQQKIGSGNWKKLCDTIKDTVYQVSVRSGVKQYFRVRAKVADRWPYDDWSNTEMVTLDVTGISDNPTSDKILLAPNPASTKLNIRFGKFVPSQISIFNIYGQQVLHISNVPKVSGFSLNIASLPQGCYFLHLTDSTRHLKTLKFIKQ